MGDDRIINENVLMVPEKDDSKAMEKLVDIRNNLKVLPLYYGIICRAEASTSDKSTYRLLNLGRCIHGTEQREIW